MKPITLDAAQEAYDIVKSDEPWLPTNLPRISLHEAQGGRLLTAMVHNGTALLVFDRGFVALLASTVDYDGNAEIVGHDAETETVALADELYRAALVSKEDLKAYRVAIRNWAKRDERASAALSVAEKEERKAARRERRPARKASW